VHLVLLLCSAGLHNPVLSFSTGS